MFLLNLEDSIVSTVVSPRWGIPEAKDLLRDQELRLVAGAFEIEMSFGEVRVIHCVDV